MFSCICCPSLHLCSPYIIVFWHHALSPHNTPQCKLQETRTLYHIRLPVRKSAMMASQLSSPLTPVRCHQLSLKCLCFLSASEFYRHKPFLAVPRHRPFLAVSSCSFSNSSILFSEQYGRVPQPISLSHVFDSLSPFHGVSLGWVSPSIPWADLVWTDAELSVPHTQDWPTTGSMQFDSLIMLVSAGKLFFPL